MNNLGLTSLSENEKLNSQINNYYNYELIRFKSYIKFNHEELRKNQDYFFYEQEDFQVMGFEIEDYEFPSLYDQSKEDFYSAQKNAVIKFLKSNKGRNMTLWDLDGKRFSYRVLNKFKKQTEDLLKSIDAELKAQNLQIEYSKGNN